MRVSLAFWKRIYVCEVKVAYVVEGVELCQAVEFGSRNEITDNRVQDVSELLDSEDDLWRALL